MNINDIIGQGLQEIDGKKPLINYLVRNTKAQFERRDDPQRSVAHFYDKETNKLIISSEYERLAAYYNKYNIWVWAWSLPLLFHSENSLSIEILKHVLQLGPEYTYLKTLFATSRGIINDPIQVDINLGLCSQILKKPHIMTLSQDTDWFIVLLNKEDLDKLEKELELKDTE